MGAGTLATIGAGMVTLGAALGIGMLTVASVQGIARQPEASKDIRAVMIIAAVLIEGVALFSAAICFLALNS